MSVKRNIVANYIGQGVASLLSLGLVPVYIRYLGIEAYALVGLFAVIQTWLSLLDIGMGPTLGREMARYTAGTIPVQSIRDLLRSLELIYLGLAMAVAATLTLGAGWLAAHWLQVDQLPVATVAGALSLLGAVVALRFCEGLYRSGIMGLQQQVWLNGATIVFALLRSVGALLVLALVSPTIQAFFVWQGLVSVLTLAATAAKLHLALPRGTRPARFSPGALRQVRRFAGGVFGITLLGLLLTQVDKLLLSGLLVMADFGYYMLGSTVAGGLYLLGGPIVLAVAPRLVRLHEHGDQTALATAYHKASQLVAVMLGPAALLLALFAPGVLFAWSGDAQLAARTAPILSLLAIGTLLNGLLQVPHQLQLAAGWTSLALRSNLVAVVVMVPLLVWAVPQHGAPAAAAVWAAINIGYLLVNIPLLHRRLLPGEMWRWYGQDIALPLAGAGAVMLAAFGLQPAGGASRAAWLLFLAVAGSSALVAAAAMAGSIRRQFLAAVVRA